MWNRRLHPYLLLVLIKKLLDSNLVSKLVSTAAEWIVLSFDTPYYTELPPYSQKTEIENWVNMCHRRCCSFMTNHNSSLKFFCHALVSCISCQDFQKIGRFYNEHEKWKFVEKNKKKKRNFSKTERFSDEIKQNIW